MKAIKLKNGQIFKTSDPYIIKDVEMALSNAAVPDDYQIKGAKRTVLKSEIDSIVGYTIYSAEELPEPYFLLRYGFEKHEIKSIPLKEYEKALYAQLKGQQGMYVGEGLSLRGDRIILLDLDGNRMCGFNADYHPEGEFLREVNDMKIKYRGIMADTKDKIHYCLKNNAIKEIGTGLPLSTNLLN